VFELARKTATLKYTAPAYTAADGVQYGKTETTTDVPCIFSDGGTLSLRVDRGGGQNVGQEQAGDANMATQYSTGITWSSFVNTNAEISCGGVRYRIIQLATRPRGWYILTLRKIT
jgi:hypothetical protein